ncbi:MAG: hypothetical protein COS97_03245, partial [Candidatus Nealsonbacteria bacterium CG07_land_8_20_14_0_80_40_10]
MGKKGFFKSLRNLNRVKNSLLKFLFTKLSLKKKNSSEKDFFLPQDQRKIASIIHQEQTLEEKYQGLDKKLYLIQKSTKTLIPAFCLLHHKLRQKFKWYYNWHLRPACSKIHLGVLALYTAGVIFASALALLSPPIKETIAQPQQAKQEL